MKIDLDTPLLTLTGEPYKENGKVISIGSVLATCLDSGREGGRMKLFVLAKRCFEGGTADFDEADITLLKRSVENSTITSNIIIGQLLLMLEK
jgi:hypothetical protein